MIIFIMITGAFGIIIAKMVMARTAEIVTARAARLMIAEAIMAKAAKTVTAEI
jgi:hypothetical protein